ncbi:hypothetical protein KOR34_40240 [Posidoniimonas corsicana]|uniref:VWFC domain-containing protein n=1 Tax=Posidoniimonas corsicana TaxID=1938618 RepID=A0A5C5V3D9_9BACT|nr:hypothetical protein [Posidoniimonas corsicana]TWT32262.1 hypothetical protein KOR34_40240 [Posidoniimonas corsicana]
MLISPTRLLLSVVLVCGLWSGAALAQPLPPGLMGGPEMGEPEVEQPDDLFTDPGPRGRGTDDSEGGAVEELAAPAIDEQDDSDLPSAAEPTEEEASRLVQYNSIQNPWLPLCDDEPHGWIEELAVPPSCLDCTCHGKSPGEACKVWRSFQKPTHPDIDQDCVVCVKEPCLGYVKEHYTTDAVVQKCFVSEKCFTDKECADGRCIETRGTKTVKQLYPCKAKVKLYYLKPVVQYRDVYYYINCEPCNESDQQVAMQGGAKKAS